MAWFGEISPQSSIIFISLRSVVGEKRSLAIPVEDIYLDEAATDLQNVVKTDRTASERTTIRSWEFLVQFVNIEIFS